MKSNERLSARLALFSVVVHTPDVVGRFMAGPGIRAWNMARILSSHFQTTLIADLRDEDSLQGSSFPMLQRKSGPAATALRNASVIIGQPSRELLAVSGQARQKILFDLFDPLVLELAELYAPRPTPRQRIHLSAEWYRLGKALRSADGLIVATPQQVNFYRGVADGLGISAPENFLLVPFGVDELDSARLVSESRSEGLPIFLWGGGLWKWLDPATAIAAVQLVNAEGSRCRLLFPAGLRPGTIAAPQQNLEESDSVILSPEWVAYQERGAWLRQARGALMLHRRTLEAEFSIRTRLFDALAAAIPIIATEGGYASDLVTREALGVVVPPQDPEAVAMAMRAMIEDDAFHARSVSAIRQVAPGFRWHNVVAPLVKQLSAWH